MNSQNKLITVKEATEISGKSSKKIYNSIANHTLHRFGDKQILLQENEVLEWSKSENANRQIHSPYGNITLDYNESLKLIDGIHNPNNIAKIGKYLTEEKYAVSNIGQILNLTRNSILTPSPAAHGYLQVTMGNGDHVIHERVHVMVAMFWCPNGKLKEEVHHIDGNKLNNNAINLIWVTHEEHDKAHKLLDEAKETGNFTKYNRYIAKIQKNNRWKEEYRCIVFEDANSAIFYWVKKDAYVDYLNGVRRLDDIYGYEMLEEFHLLKND